MELLAMIIETIFFATILVIYLVTDRIILHKRLKETQIAWDEYSKDMTRQERSENYLEWCENHREEKGYRLFYFPNELHIRPSVFQTTINGIKYRGTKQEISEQSGVGLSFLESFDGLPMEMVLEPIQTIEKMRNMSSEELFKARLQEPICKE